MNDLETRTPGALSAAKKDSPAYSSPAITPAVDVVEDSSGITLYADLPGVSKDKLQLQTESDTLTIEAELDIPVPEGLQTAVVDCIRKAAERCKLEPQTESLVSTIHPRAGPPLSTATPPRIAQRGSCRSTALAGRTRSCDRRSN